MSFEPFRQLTSKSIKLPQENIDTDQIIPAKFLTTTERSGLGAGAFYGWRYDADGELIEDHPLNTDDRADRQILVAGDNFGCGSSREHAPWALLDYGFRVVISTKMGDIFRSNSLKNGFLAIIVPEDTHKELMESDDPEITVDLEANELRFANHVVPFTIDPFARFCLLEGQDQLGVLVGTQDDITTFEEQHA